MTNQTRGREHGIQNSLHLVFLSFIEILMSEKPSPQPRLTDRLALKRNRQRWVHEREAFLHEIAFREIDERRKDVNKNFQKIAVVTGFPEIWSGFMPTADMVDDQDLLTFSSQGYDLVIHAMGLHWANDPVGQLVQSRLALKPDGLFLAVFFGGETLHELRSALTLAEIDLRGGAAPRVAPMGDIRDYGGLLQRAGLMLPVADRLPLKTTYPSLQKLLNDLQRMGETNALDQRARTFPPKAFFEIAETKYSHRDPENRLEATFELFFLSGWCAHDSQQKPLKPGSAKVALRDVLAQGKERK